jgi:glycosyltransferase involved in cell wall biosynthesis
MTHVVMLVTNDVSTDTRVKKEALAVARLGLQVTVLGTTTQAERWETSLGPVRIIRAPVTFTMRDERVQRRSARRRDLLSLRPAWLARRAPATPAVAPAPTSQAEPVPPGTGPATVQPTTGSSAVVGGKAGAVARRAKRSVVARGKRLRRKALRARKVYAAKTVRVGNVAYRRAWSAYDTGIAKVPYHARWRAVLPEVLDYERALAPVIDELRPDLLHAHDMQVVGIATAAAERARAAGRDLRWIYDAHEFVPGLSQYGGRTRRIVAAWADLEQEYVRNAARVITVSPPIAEALQRVYQLDRRPAVVLNAPVIDPPRGPRPALREVVGLPDGVPLVVYSGMMTKARGVHTAIEAMLSLPDAHLALVCVPHTETWSVRQLKPLSTQLGLDDRVHFLNPVGSGEVVDFLRSADVGLVPLLHFPSHEMALANKVFEYLNAGVPVVVSDCRTQAEFVREHRIGEVFPAGDPGELAAAVRRVLADRPRYASAASDPELLVRYSWRHQEDVLREVYADVLGTRLEWVHGGPDGLVMDLTESPAAGGSAVDVPT